MGLLRVSLYQRKMQDQGHQKRGTDIRMGFLRWNLLMRKENDCGVACSVVTICRLSAIISFNPLCISFLQEKNDQTENDLCARGSCTCNAINTNLLTLIVSISDCHYQMWYTDHRRCRRKDPPELYSHVACTHSMHSCCGICQTWQAYSRCFL